jgi:hypothetical protein
MSAPQPPQSALLEQVPLPSVPHTSSQTPDGEQRRPAGQSYVAEHSAQMPSLHAFAGAVADPHWAQSLSTVHVLGHFGEHSLSTQMSVD